MYLHTLTHCGLESSTRHYFCISALCLHVIGVALLPLEAAISLSHWFSRLRTKGLATLPRPSPLTQPTSVDLLLFPSSVPALGAGHGSSSCPVHFFEKHIWGRDLVCSASCPLGSAAAPSRHPICREPWRVILSSDNTSPETPLSHHRLLFLFWSLSSDTLPSGSLFLSDSYPEIPKLDCGGDPHSFPVARIRSSSAHYLDISCLSSRVHLDGLASDKTSRQYFTLYSFSSRRHSVVGSTSLGYHHPRHPEKGAWHRHRYRSVGVVSVH